ncbi:PREDICTED: F-box/kelch-repeat protein At4g38940-like [Camelina sativa]|uniref:F-box/kelch-repeat protein At4g38940-like n=1 Tax=Camelina sativa TaxID=90675 RepID=A0ABM1QPS4_CAMSA|nr:PREDICTED: F-box/kelch-repeat protein At4g38940-like [Camelina sativa]
MSSQIRSPKKQPPEPPCLISLLPEEIVVDIISRVPRCCYPTLSQVSKRFRSLVSSPELYTRRSSLGFTEQCLYVAISKDQTSDIHWFTLCRKPNGGGEKTLSGGDHRLVHIPSLPPMPLHGSYIGLGPNIFVMGGFCDWKITSSVSLIDCRTHTAQSLTNMPKAVAIAVTELIDRKIYIIGGSDTLSPLKSPSRSIMVFDTDAETWSLNSRPDWEQGKRWFSSVAIGGKIYMRTCYNSFVYEPNEDVCDKDVALHSKEWSSACVIDDVLYYYDVCKNCLRAYDPKQSSWGVVRGFEGVLPQACKWSKTASYNGGRLVLFLQKTEKAEIWRAEKTEIWCAEIAVERRAGGEIWGKVEWCNVVLGGNFHIMECVTVVL